MNKEITVWFNFTNNDVLSKFFNFTNKKSDDKGNYFYYNGFLSKPHHPFFFPSSFILLS
jgi:hypothetical protein